MALAENLRRTRLEHAYTQGELAEAAGLHIRTVVRIEQGGERLPSLSTLRALAGALNVRPTDLATFEEIERMADQKKAEGRVTAQPPRQAPAVTLAGTAAAGV